MSFYDDASWVLIPEGIKEDVVYAQKPTDGLGDLTFTRASDATRTNSAGEIERTPWNLQSNSEMFTLSNWTKILTTIVANTITAPNGTLTADTLRSTVNGTSTRYRLYGEVNVVSGVTYTGSYYLKKANHRWIQIVAPNNFNTAAWANFDLEEGVIGNKGAGVVAIIQSIGDGWYRCSVTGVATATASDTNFNLVLTNNTNSARYPAYISTTAEDVCYVWGAQVVEGTDAKPYFATTNRQDVPRLDYRNADGTLNSCPRLLLEPQRTNSIRNSTMVGAVAGSPGTLPTNWLNSQTAGLSRQIIGVGTENGLQYIDLRFFGTTNTGDGIRIDLETGTSIAAATGQTWAYSLYAKLISGTIPTTSFFFFERNALGSSVTSGGVAFLPTSTLSRFNSTRTLSGGVTVAFVQTSLSITTANATAYDFTIRIAAPQMELGAYATTFIPTTTAAVTRLIDVPQKSGISSLIGQTEGTIFAEVYISQLQGAVARTFIDIGSTNNRIFLGFTGGASNTVRLQIDTLVNTVRVDFRAVIASVGTIKVAAAYKNGDCALYVNGVAGTQLENNSFSFTTLSNLVVGQTISGTALLNDSIAQAALFTRRLTNAELAAITTL
jgi:hypothetical protein